METKRKDRITYPYMGPLGRQLRGSHCQFRRQIIAEIESRQALELAALVDPASAAALIMSLHDQVIC